MDSFFENLVQEHNQTITKFFEENQQKIYDLVDLIELRLKTGAKILSFGNGGSASDSSHFVGELVGRFERERKGIAAISLTADSVNLTALGNDYGYDQIFARQVEALANNSDILLGITTSGKSPNILTAFEKAPTDSLKILLTSSRVEPTENEVEKITNFIFKVPHTRTAIIQECHIVFLHVLAQLIEERI